jgi:hypothetical protein
MFINTLALLSTLTLSVMAQDSLSTSYFFGYVLKTNTVYML